MQSHILVNKKLKYMSAFYIQNVLKNCHILIINFEIVLACVITPESERQRDGARHLTSLIASIIDRSLPII